MRRMLLNETLFISAPPQRLRAIERLIHLPYRIFNRARNTTGILELNKRLLTECRLRNEPFHCTISYYISILYHIINFLATIVLSAMVDYILNVRGMSCEGCEHIIQSELTSLSGISAAEADSDTGEVQVYGDQDTTPLARQTILDIGYDLAA